MHEVPPSRWKGTAMWQVDCRPRVGACAVLSAVSLLIIVGGVV